MYAVYFVQLYVQAAVQGKEKGCYKIYLTISKGVLYSSISIKVGLQDRRTTWPFINNITYTEKKQEAKGKRKKLNFLRDMSPKWGGDVDTSSA